MATGMPVPETAVHEHGDPVFRQDDVRGAGEVLAMQPEPQAQRKQHAPNFTFRAGILAADAPHILATSLSRDMIHGYHSEASGVQHALGRDEHCKAL